MHLKYSSTSLMLTASAAGGVVVAVDCLSLLETSSLLGVRHVHIADLDARLMAAVAPGLVILPLFAAGHDAVMAIEVLEALGYAGRIAVLAPALPKPRLVERELQGLGPGQRLVLITP